jgi:hypothetical protein
MARDIYSGLVVQHVDGPRVLLYRLIRHEGGCNIHEDWKPLKDMNQVSVIFTLAFERNMSVEFQAHEIPYKAEGK